MARRRPILPVAVRIPLFVLGYAAQISLGCSHLPGWQRDVPACPGQLISTDQMGDDFLLIQRARVEWGEERVVLRLITEKRGDEFVQVGIDPLGAKLFTVRQHGTELDVEAMPAPVLRVAPVNFIRDLHRTRFLRASNQPIHPFAQRELDGTIIKDIWKQDRLVERRFQRLENGPEGVVSLRFETPPPGGEGIARVVLDNAWCDYRAEVVTLVEERLP